MVSRHSLTHAKEAAQIPLRDYEHAYRTGPQLPTGHSPADPDPDPDSIMNIIIIITF
jgi:hypothetical protein